MQLSSTMLNRLNAVDSTHQVFEDNLKLWKFRVGGADTEMFGDRRDGSVPGMQNRLSEPESEPKGRSSAGSKVTDSRKTSVVSLRQGHSVFNSQSWEYPLTTEDKKRRLLWLAELEMAAGCDGRSENSPRSHWSASNANNEVGSGSAASNPSTASDTSSIPGYLDELEDEQDLRLSELADMQASDMQIEEPMVSVQMKTARSRSSSVPVQMTAQAETMPRVPDARTKEAKAPVKSRVGLPETLKAAAVEHGPQLLVLGVALLGRRVRLGG